MQFRWYRFNEFDSDTLYSVLALRQSILVVEQLSPYLDLDYVDQTASHLLATNGTELVGYTRCHGQSRGTNYTSFGRLVVSTNYRGKGLGKELVQRVLARLADEPCDVVISAQLYLKNFYLNFGFALVGEPYDDAGVAHVDMRLPYQKAAL